LLHKFNSMKNIFLLTFLLWSFFLPSLSAKVWINELMQSNINVVTDDLHEFPDSWIELYNDADQAVNIQNWTISNDVNYKNGWKITVSVVIAPKSYRLIYADEAATGLHAQFRVDSGSGSALYLFDANGNQIDAVTNIPKQPAPNIARGRISDGNASWAYFVSATPGSTNTGNTSNTLLPPPVFSQAGGIFKNAVTVSLSLPANMPKDVALSNIHYTLNNSEPTLNSPSYTEALKITKTTVVRSKLIHPDYLSAWSKVNTYIISTKDLPLPVISISTDSAYLWDSEFGIYCKGNGKYGVISNGVDFPANWNNDWRRPMNFEYFPLESQNSSVLNQLGEMRLSGGWSRANPQKSFIVYGNKRFGVKRYEYDFFKEKPNQEIKSFMIRNSGNDFWYTQFRDAAIQLFFGGKVDIDYQAYQPTIFYLNGQYWGIQNLRERSDEDFVLANYGLADTDIDMFESWWDLKAGDWTALNQLTNEMKKSSSQQNYQWIMDQIDLGEFINYMILQIYVANTDFLSDYDNNVVLWRPRTSNGKWRFILKDTDQGLGIWNMNAVTHNALNTQYNNNTWKLLSTLLTQDSFKKDFYGRFAIYMGDLLHYNSTSHLIDSIQALIEPAMQDHLTRWMQSDYVKYGMNAMWWRDMNSWRGEVSGMKNWCRDRNVNVYQQLRDRFKLGAIMQLTYKTANDLDGTPVVFINNVRMRDSGLNGSYFQGEKIELRYEGNTPHYGWEITQITNGTVKTETYFQQNLSYPIGSGCTSVNIKLVSNPTAITQPVLPGINLSVFDNQLQISNFHLPSVISIYDVSGKLVTKTATTGRSILIPFYRQKGIYIVEVRNDVQKLTQKVVL